MSGRRRGRIRNELIGGFVAVILLSGLATYASVLSWSRRNFDTMVEKNDVEIAKSFAEGLASYYASTGSWAGAAKRIEELRRPPAGAAAGDDKHGDRKHSRDSDIPLILTDAAGVPAYVGIRARDGEDVSKMPSRLWTEHGEAVQADGKTVGYVLFKSMIFQSYNPQEEAFINSLAVIIGVSVSICLVLAILLAALFSSRFARPIVALDRAVRNIADGDRSARVAVKRGNEIGNLAESFNMMADKLQATETARQNLLADIAHELRTPVAVLQANLEMIMEGVYAPDADRLKSLYEETRILADLISHLRSLSDLDAGIVDVRLERMSLTALLEETAQKMRPLFEEREVGLECAAGGAEFHLIAEEDKLRQVLRNVLGNALKYSPSGSKVVLAAAAEGDHVRITVADEGCGVPESDTEKIFERFYRVDPSRNRESGGRGLGLAISKKIVEAFHGGIGVYNRKPTGLTVWMTLPLADDGEGSSAAPCRSCP